MALLATFGYPPSMTKLLEQALREVAKWSDAEQDALETAILAEVAGDTAWDARFRASAPALARLADEARSEHRRGLFQLLDPDTSECPS